MTAISLTSVFRKHISVQEEDVKTGLHTLIIDAMGPKGKPGDQRPKAPLRVSFGSGGTDLNTDLCERNGAAYYRKLPLINTHIVLSYQERMTRSSSSSLDFDMTVKYNTNENSCLTGRLDLVTAALKAIYGYQAGLRSLPTV